MLLARSAARGPAQHQSTVQFQCHHNSAAPLCVRHPIAVLCPAAWEHFLHEYKAAHPEVVIIDRLDRIRALHNRATMLTPLKGDGITLAPVRPQQQHHSFFVVDASTTLQHHHSSCLIL